MNISLGNGWDSESFHSADLLVKMVAETFENLVGSELCRSVIVNNDDFGPMAHYDLCGESFLISLNVRSGHYWSQIAYQLAHELCHIYSNHASDRAHKHKWLEESLCEAASISTIKKLASDWSKSPLAKLDPDYGQKLLIYINRIHDSTRIILIKDDFDLWLKQSLMTLESDSTRRDLNNVVAVYLYEGVFSKTHESWRSVRHLNRWSCSELTFEKFVVRWRLSIPESDRCEISNLFHLIIAK